jgi:hypothetical protein
MHFVPIPLLGTAKPAHRKIAILTPLLLVIPYEHLHRSDNRKSFQTSKLVIHIYTA